MGILDLLSRIMEGFGRSEYVGALFCDLSKVFDCATHDILLEKLKYYQFNNNSLLLVLGQ